MNMKKLRFLSLGFSDIQKGNLQISSDDSDSLFEYIENLNWLEENPEKFKEYYAKNAKETIQNLSLEIKNDTITTLFIGHDLDELIKYIPALTSLEMLIIHEELELKHIKFIGK